MQKTHCFSLRKYFLLVGLFLLAGQVGAAELPDLGAVAVPNYGRDVNPGNPNTLPTTTRFAGGMADVGSDDFISNSQRINQYGEEGIFYITASLLPVQIRFRINPQREHIGKRAKISIVAAYFPFNLDLLFAAQGGASFDSIYGQVAGERASIAYFMLNEHSQPIFLATGNDGWNADQLIPFRDTVLRDNEEFSIWQGPLPDGYIFLLCFYVLEDGTTVFNKVIPSIWVMKINNRTELDFWRSMLEILF